MKKAKSKVSIRCHVKDEANNNGQQIDGLRDHGSIDRQSESVPMIIMKRHFPLATVFAAMALAALVSGCAALSALPVASAVGSPNAAALEIHNNTDVQLRDNNFIVVKTNVVGQSSGFSLLGFITIVPAKFTKAMSRLYTQAEMQPGRPQTLVNLIMEKDARYYILFSLPRTSIRADVIEFVPAASLNSQSHLPRDGARSRTEQQEHKSAD